MLEQRAFESFRVVTMDSRTRLAELSAVAHDVQADRIPPATMQPCIEEIAFSFRNDPIIKKRHPGLAKLFTEQTRKTPEKNGLRKFRSLLNKGVREVSDEYRGELDQAIYDEINGRGDQDTLKSLLHSYVSLLINLGYSRQFLRKKVLEHFFERDFRRLHPRSVNSFLGKFDGKNRKFNVTIALSEHGANYLGSLGLGNLSFAKLATLPVDAQAAFKRSAYRSSEFATIELSAIDEVGALKASIDVFRTLESMARLSGRTVDFKIPESGFVRQSRSTAGTRIKLTSLILSRYTNKLTPGIASEVGTYTKAVLSSFDGSSMGRAFSSINMAALSGTSQRPENSLITLWSAIEVLLGDPPVGTPRIAYYVGSLTPCICSTYFKRYTAAIMSALDLHYRNELKAALSDVAIDQAASKNEQFVQLIFDPNALNSKRVLFGDLRDNPLIMYRVEKLFANFSTRGSFQESVLSHEKRVSWQLHRIYRTRNNIIHGGRLPTFLNPLVRNVSEYFNSAAEAIVQKASKSTGKTSLGQSVDEVGFDYELLKLRLREGNPADVLSIAEINALC